MRGTRQQRLLGTRKERFTPAHAGNTRTDDVSQWRVAVHPRACGEHGSGIASSIHFSGSPPRMRGTRQFVRPAGHRIRFTPAHAGNTRRVADACRALTVHPRACGEHFVLGCRLVREAGSPPRMRGTHLLYILDNTRKIQRATGYRTEKAKKARILKQRRFRQECCRRAGESSRASVHANRLVLAGSCPASRNRIRIPYSCSTP